MTPASRTVVCVVRFTVRAGRLVAAVSITRDVTARQQVDERFTTLDLDGALGAVRAAGVDLVEHPRRD